MKKLIIVLFVLLVVVLIIGFMPSPEPERVPVAETSAALSQNGAANFALYEDGSVEADLNLAEYNAEDGSVLTLYTMNYLTNHYTDFVLDGCFNGDKTPHTFHYVVAGGKADTKESFKAEDYDTTLSADNFIERIRPFETEYRAIKDAIDALAE